MKKISLRLTIIFLAASFLIPVSLSAQKSILKEVREVGAFSGIDAGGAFDIILSQAEHTKVVVETESKNIDKVITKVNNGILEISSKGIKNSDNLKVYVTSPNILSINIHGASSLNGITGLQGTAIKIKASGASDGELELYFDQITSDVSGAASLTLTGEAAKHTTNVNGAGSLDAAQLKTEVTKANVSGAGSASINASTELVSNTKGAGSIDLVQKPETITLIAGQVIGENENLSVKTTYYGDTTNVRIAGIKVEVIDDDSTRITIGNRRLTVSEDGNVKWCKVKYRKFNGHWAGFELGINGYLTKDFNMKFKPEDEYLDLSMGKGFQVNMNFYEQNVALSKNQEWGMLTGIGLQWNNYHFRQPTSLFTDSSYLIGYIDKGVSVRKSKLSAAYLQIPLIFEWQNQTLRKRNSVHVGLGVILGVRLWSWQKKYYNEQNKAYTLTQYDETTGKYQDVAQRTSPGYSKTHTYDDYFLQTFKADATLRIGWGFVNLFTTYNLVPMFRADKGPELHQFSAGITLLGW